jgi:glycine cleavage system aminomethyltransferase T/NADPH-dependent 2,4-dienoyl-CoA reductase/sulfur reductase-like enzyme
MSASRSGRRLGNEPVRFRFDGREFTGLAGDTAASALLASGVRLFGRSVKYRRPRGVLTAGWDEPNALLTLGVAGQAVPNLPATVLPIAAGCDLGSQNRRPDLRHDLSSCLGLGGGLLAAGFYYKTFIWPSWRAYEGLIRRLAGFGPAPRSCAAAPPRIEHARCDVLVVGGGPAGLAAAVAAADAGATVILCEREPVCGGELEFENATIGDADAHAWVARSVAMLAARGARVLTGTAVVARSGDLVYAHGVADGQTAAHSWRIAARTVVVATGAVERPIAFVDNDRPGVMLLGAAESMLARYGVRVGERAVLFGNHDRLYAAATRLQAGRVGIAAIIDVRPGAAVGTDASALRASLLTRGVECLAGHAVVAAKGRLGVRAAQVVALNGAGSPRRIDCDAILVSGGWTATGSRNEMHGHDVTGHALTLADALAAGHAAGLAAAGQAAQSPAMHATASGDPSPNPQPFARSPCDRGGEKRQFVDFQNDVTVADLRQALAEGFCEIEHVKRYTTLGVGTDQGRIGGALGAAILAELGGKDVSAAYTSRTRAPLQPATLAVLAGRHRSGALRPARRTPLHEWHVANDAEMESMGMWMRPRYYRANGPDAGRAGIAEAARVRSRGGLVDGSTLGKIDIAGPAAEEFIDRVCLTRGSTIRDDRARYMVLLREDGMVLDDGLVLRLGPDRFLATTSSSHANHILSHLEYWRDLEFATRGVALTDVTEAWAVIVVAGPASPGALTQVLGPEWISSLAGLTHMEHRAGLWRGAGLRVLRASFSGELAYELHCRPRIACGLWEALHATGLAPYGIEALDVLRVEKGYLTGAEMNGQVTPLDLGLEPLLEKNPGCIGADLLDRPAFREPRRPRLVGLQSVEPHAQFHAGAQLTVDAQSTRACGYVTSSCRSPALERHVALALVSRELAEGAELYARDALRGLETRVRVTSPIHFDSAGIRMKGR